MQNLIYKIYRKLPQILYIVFWKVRILSFKKKHKVLISNFYNERINTINSSFKFTPYEVSFGNIKKGNFQSTDIILPLAIDELLDINKNIHVLATKIVPISNTQSILLCDNKDEFNSYLLKSKFKDYIPALGHYEKLSFPYILKKKIDEYGQNTHIINNKEEEIKYSNEIDSKEYFTQELIQGTQEYATHILVGNKKILHSINIKYVFNTASSIKGQNKSQLLYTTKCDSPYDAIFESILQYISFEGICCINYKISNGIPMILEINPRVGGSLSPYLFIFIHIYQKYLLTVK